MDTFSNKISSNKKGEVIIREHEMADVGSISKNTHGKKGQDEADLSDDI
jgi:hypothetical protein